MASVIDIGTNVVRRFGATTGLVLASQAISSVSIFLLPALGLGVSDAYSTAIQVGTGTFTGLVMGVLYLLAIGRPHFSGWVRSRMLVALFAIVLAPAAYAVALHSGNLRGLSEADAIVTLSCFGLGGVFLALAGVEGVRLACVGRPLLLAGTTILPNACMALTIVAGFLFRHRLSVWPAAPSIAWMIGATLSLAIALLLTRKLASDDLPADTYRDVKDSRSNKAMHLVGLLIGVVISTVYPIAFVSAVSRLHLGAATILFIFSRVGSALIGVLINSVLLVSVSWKSDERRLGPFPLYAMLASLFSALVAGAVHLVGGPAIASYGFVVCAWLLCLSATPLVLRETNRRRMGSAILAKSTVDGIVSTAALVALFHSPSVTGYFGVFCLSQCISCMICAVPLKERSLVIASVAMGIMAGFFVLAGW